MRGLIPCLLVISLLLALGACGQTQTRPEKLAPQDLAEIYRLAAAAYEAQDWAASERHYLDLTRGAPEEVEPWFKLGTPARNVTILPLHAIGKYLCVIHVT